MTVFQSLGQLGSWLQANPGVSIVDAGMPLTDATNGGEYGPVWSCQPSVRKVVGFIARNTASIPLRVYDRVDDDDRQRVTDHPLARLMARPSRAPGETPYRFWERVLIDGLIFDRWCLMKLRHDDGDYELVRIPARRVRFRADGMDRIDLVQVWGNDGKYTEHDPSKFVLDAGYSERGASGTSPLQTLKHLLDEAREAVEYRRGVWRNSARVPAVLERDREWSSGEARDRFAASWRAFISGGGNEGGTPILEDGMKLAPFEAFKPQDTGDLEGRRLTDIETAAAYHIAPELVGAREGNFSTIEAFRQMLYRDNLGPYIEAWVQALNASLVADLAPGSDLYVEPHMEAKLRGSFEEQAKILSSAIGAPWMTRAEGRGRMNLPAIDDADELVVPLNVLIGGQASPRDSGTQNENAGTRRVKSAPLRGPQTHEEQFRRVVAGFFRRQSASVRSALGAGEQYWWDEARWDRELTEDLAKLLTLTTEAIGKQAVTSLGFEADAYDAERTRNFLAANAQARARSINRTTKRHIDGALTSPEGLDDPVKAVAASFEGAQLSRAKEIATTAVTGASGFAVVEAGKQVGAGSKTWTTSGQDSRHADIDGETVDVYDTFSNGARFPADTVALSMAELAGCLCTVTLNPA